MPLCGDFDGSELVGKAEFEHMQRKRMVNRIACNQNLLQVNQRILQLTLMMQLPQVIDGVPNLQFSSANALSLQLFVFGAMDSMVILVIAAPVMAAYYRFLWKSAIADNDRWLEISEKLASRQHQRAMEGLREDHWLLGEGLIWMRQQVNPM